MSTPIKHAPRATLSAIGRAILTAGPKRPFDVAQFITELYRLGAKVGYDPLALIGQCCFETAVGGVPFASDLWNAYLNPAGIGQTDGGPKDRLETNDPFVAARAYLVHIGGYIEGPDGGWLKDTQYKGLDPRWKYLGKDQFGKVQNVEDLGGGLWASTATPKSQYTAGVLKYMKLCGWTSDAATPPVVTPPPAPKPAGKLPYILLVAGHRSTGAGGEADSDPIEASLTQFLAADYETAFKQAGYDCDWFQRTLDGDDLPTETRGNLDTVALGTGRVLRNRKDDLSIMLDCHYNGAHSVAHTIVPDNRGLTTAYAGGAPGDDTAANNTWDVDLAGKIAAAINPVIGTGLFAGKIGVPGVMSETECGVGLDGYRLAMFAATADSRAKAVRLIIEHGGHQDTAAKQDDFSAKCAAAVIGAVNQFVTTTVAKG